MAELVPPGIATPESISAALTMWSGQIPCFFALAEPSCPATAGWIVYFEHEEAAPGGCPCESPYPVCEDHLRAIRQVTNPFWRTWMRLQTTLCPHCKVPTRLARTEPIAA